MFDVCVAGYGLYVLHVTAEEGEYGQRDAYAQSPSAQELSELLNVELLSFCLQLTSMTSGVVVAETLSDDLAGRALDHIKGVVAAWLDDISRGKRRCDHVRLLVELVSGLTCTCAQPVENGDALGD